MCHAVTFSIGHYFFFPFAVTGLALLAEGGGGAAPFLAVFSAGPFPVAGLALALPDASFLAGPLPTGGPSFAI
jgi:hypothetical protein